jgi:hypothetical protein
MPKINRNRQTENDEVARLLRHLLAVTLWRAGVKQDVIAKHLRLAKATVVQMLAGVNRDD